MKALRQTERLLFLLFFVSSAYFFQGGFDNPNSHFDLSLSLAFDHRLAVDSFKNNTVDRAFYDGHFYSEKPPGISYLAMPVPLVASAFFTTQDVLSKPELGDALLYLATILSAGLLSALGALAFRRTLILINPRLSMESSLVFVLIYFFGTLIFPYSTMLFSHGVTAALLSIAIYWAVQFQDRPNWKLALGLGFALGLAVLSEAPLAIIAGILMCAFLWRGRRHKTSYLALLGATVCAGALLIHNSLSFNDPFDMGYSHLESNSFFKPGMGQGFFGLVAPNWRVLVNLLASSYRGLFVFVPVLVLPTIGLFSPKGGQSFRLFPVLRLCIAAHLLLISSYHFWQGGVAFGPRHLVPLIPLLCLGFANLPRRLNHWWIIFPLSALSFVINFVGTFTTPFVDEDDASPLFSAYRYLVEHDGIAVNPMHFLTPTAEATARWKHVLETPEHGATNLAQFFGLSHWASLLPLFAFWIICGLLLKSKTQERAKKNFPSANRRPSR